MAKAVPISAASIAVAGGLVTQRVAGVPVLGAFGNSWVAQGLSGNDIGAKGFLNCVHSRLRGRMAIKSSAILGYSGQSSTQIATDANISALIAAGPSIVLVEMLINDYTSGVTLAQSRANIDTVVTRLSAAGIIPIFGTIPPRSDANNTSALRLFNYTLNDYLLTKARLLPAGTMHVADVASALTSRASSVGIQYRGYGSDGVHPIDLGAWDASKPYFDIIDRLLPPTPPYAAWRTTSFDRTNYTTGWATANPAMFGSSGTITSGGSVSDTLADSFTLTRTSGSNFTATCSKVTGVNGGEYQRLVFSGTNSTSDEQLELSINAAGLQTGDVAFAVADISATGLSNILGIYVYLNGSATGLWRGMNNSGVTGDTTETAFDRANFTLDVPILANETVTFKIVIVSRKSTTVAGTVDIKLAGIKVRSAHA